MRMWLLLVLTGYVLSQRVISDRVASTSLMAYQILRFFSPNMGPMDTISGGQFFAALRLVVHVESGSDLDRGLAFIQGTYC